MKNNYIAVNYKRLINFLIDTIVILLFFILIILLFYKILNIAKLEIELEIHNWHFFVIYNLYYVFFEKITGKTLGKIITKTKVVTMNSEHITWKSVIIRSLARILLFEVFLYLKKYPIGLHDKISNTIVINDYN